MIEKKSKFCQNYSEDLRIINVLSEYKFNAKFAPQSICIQNSCIQIKLNFIKKIEKQGNQIFINNNNKVKNLPQIKILNQYFMIKQATVKNRKYPLQQIQIQIFLNFSTLNKKQNPEKQNIQIQAILEEKKIYDRNRLVLEGISIKKVDNYKNYNQMQFDIYFLIIMNVSAFEYEILIFTSKFYKN
ncbi:transmembrane protein, putative (macronuclear) [Tetrahymena thermophila SB210]|uniref:Transmembrane protein, putative n=1 Tax=Tetrahymena thermophila (strain SB210) TaxID=312017 RepID=W7XHT7_TETTS|nr:transmembrane protein, putative [Tetrahymena thermophila SB210]EWS74036.1 transmembrane protein, putative [Tetrahymena thermophila SB210]|eukprot:XP_012653435.1 transmembrane protein, putative [Tetrahymena thermophila SB210]